MTQNDYLHMSYLLKLFCDFYLFNPLMPGGNKKVTHT